jgi:hypothetical protein
MYIVPIAWLYVALMMAVAEATNTNGTVLGAIITFVLYGLGPVALVVYLMGTPARQRAIKARQAQELAAQLAAPQAGPGRSGEPDAGPQAAGDTIAPVRKEP